MVTNSMEAIDRVKDAELILIPKNSNEEGALDWLRENGFDPPDFPGRSLTQTSEGRTYSRRRDPEIISDVERGAGDVGFVGSDKFEEWQPALAVDWVGMVPDCDFVLATNKGTPAIEAKLDSGDRVYVVTSNVNWLAKFALKNSWDIDSRYVSGSAEAYASEADMIADLRVSGNSLRDNGLQEFRVLDSVKLGMVYKDPPVLN